MTDLRKAAQEAAKVLANALSIDFNDKRDWYSYKHDVEYAANLLCQALAQPEHPLDKKAENARKLGLDYEVEQPPKREWVGLTEEERDKIILGCQQRWEIAHMIEAKLKERNT